MLSQLEKDLKKTFMVGEHPTSALAQALQLSAHSAKQKAKTLNSERHVIMGKG
jgi:hypothetical protein